MNNTGQLQALLLLVLLISACSWSSTSARPGGVKLQAQLVRAISAYRRLERSLPPEELRALTGLGLLNGARQTKEQMEQHLVQAIKELLRQTEAEPDNDILPRIDAIEQQMSRDQQALKILGSVMDVLCDDKDEQQFRREVHSVLKEQQQQRQLQLQALLSEEQQEVGRRLGQLRCHILEQVPQMKTELETKIERTLHYLLKHATAGGPLDRASHKVLHKRAVDEAKSPDNIKDQIEAMLEDRAKLMEDDFRENLVVQRFEKSDDGNSAAQSENEFDELENASRNITAKAKIPTNAKQEDEIGSAELGGDVDGPDGGGGGGGGLVGIIGSLSGGEGGSDVGALIGALTGLVSTLFGPGGLDIDSLISTATSLISGLLAGDKNFGTVLGQYVGTAFDGLSGGGGAINNGQFLGNFVGTVLASLSADPDDEGPPQPLTFTKNFLSAFLESKLRPPEASEERHGSAELPRQKKKEAQGSAGFDSNGFIKQIASHLVSSALGLLLNASLGASGGASHASTGLFASSSHHMKPAEGRSWTEV
ncbi:uncharacterized protein LOC6584923 isoform X1 [Drosophila mojavensis]|uniref:Uncharacterized protein n=1 Tax=Drosophila mojavensis TaxID=7230 RepID=B4L2Z4_DROMO|nr:uncharacterized protein LOC6584923 isoform X1 [Drosophila mojavensis]EDW07880.1 uncharacterized protein Dmoj_GI14612 [Drosophila mojavensis]